MGKLEGTDGGIMGLQDSLKVECQAVPERELAARRAGQNAPPLGGPLENKGDQSGVWIRREWEFGTDRHDVDWATNFVRRGVYELGAQRRGCITWVGDGREELINVIIRSATRSY
jgi:hypothetical protein